jgi:hypothetical protein
MRSIRIRPIPAALFVAMFFLISYQQGQAQAYLDPNTGSMALQLLLAGVVGTLATVKLYWDRVKTLFVRRHTHTGDEASRER